MFLKNKAGRDSVWEAEQRMNQELVSWMLAFGEEQAVGTVNEETADKETPEDGERDEENNIMNERDVLPDK